MNILLQDNAALLGLESWESLKECFVLHDLSCVLKCSQDMHSFFCHIKDYKKLIIFSQLFWVIFSKWVIYSFPVTFIYKTLNFWYYFLFFSPISWWFNATVLANYKDLASLQVGFIVAFLFCIQSGWSSLFQIYFKTFLMEKPNTVKDKITISHWCFQLNLTCVKKWTKKLFDNFICFTINHDFYFLNTLTHFISVLRRKEVSCYCQLKFLCIRFTEVIDTLFMMPAWYQGILWLMFFFSINITFIFDIIVPMKFTSA